MGRPTQFDKDKALDTAMILFWKNGYEATSVSVLATAMGITRSSFYNAFENREKLFGLVLDRYKLEAPDGVLNDIAKGRPVLPVLEAMFREICTVRARDPDHKGCLVINSVAELGEEEKDPPFVRDLFLAMVDRFERLMRQAKDQGELAQDTDIPTLAGELAAFLAGINLMSKVVTDRESLWLTCRSFLKSHMLIA